MSCHTMIFKDLKSSTLITRDCVGGETMTSYRKKNKIIASGGGGSNVLNLKEMEREGQASY